MRRQRIIIHYESHIQYNESEAASNKLLYELKSEE